MRNLLSVGVLAVVCGSAGAQGAWRDVVVKPSDIAVRMPGAPTVSPPRSIDSSEGRATVYVVSLRTATHLFLVAYSAGPERAKRVPPGAMIDKAVQGFLEGTHATAIGEKRLTVGGHPASDLVARMPDNSAARLRTCVSPHGVCQLVVACTQSLRTDPDADRFLGSIRWPSAPAR